MAVQILRWQFTVADFARMVEAGILAEDDRVELIDGEGRTMSPIGPRHVAIVNRLNALLSRQIADRAIVSVQNRKNSVNPSQEASSGTSCHHCTGSDRAKCFGRLMPALPLSGG